MIGLTKRYGRVVAVDDLSFTVRPGRVTGFLGPNGSGKSTTLRSVVGLDTPTAGTTRVLGRPYRRLDAPLRTAGVLLDARAVHPGRSGHDHLLALARSNGLHRRRVHDVIDLVGLGDAARRPAGTYSLGMAQRLGVAAALLGDPAVVVLDEPINGLDTDGIRWIRGLLRQLAAEGRTVFVSSHVMSEMEQTADHLVVIGRGRLLADLPAADFIAAHSASATVVRSTDDAALARRLRHEGAVVETTADGALRVRGRTPGDVGSLARALDIALLELWPERRSLEDVYTDVTAGAVEYAGGGR